MKLSISPVFDGEELRASVKGLPAPKAEPSDVQRAVNVYFGLAKELRTIEEWNLGYKFSFSRANPQSKVVLNLTLNLRPISWVAQAWQVHGQYPFSFAPRRIVEMFKEKVFTEIRQKTAEQTAEISKFAAAVDKTAE